MTLVTFVFLSWAFSGFAATGDLDSELKALELPSNVAPEGVSQEKLYAVQSRYSRLASRLEVSLGGAKNFNLNSYLVSNQVDGGLRFYFTDRWFVNANGSYVFTDMTDSAQRLLETQGIVPDVSFVTQRADLLVGFHAFYGKIRVSMDDTVYFDHYITLGPGLTFLNYGQEWGGVVGTGVVAWIGNRFSVRFGVKDSIFNEKRVKSQGWVNHILGHVDVGVLIGEG